MSFLRHGDLSLRWDLKPWGSDVCVCLPMVGPGDIKKGAIDSRPSSAMSPVGYSLAGCSPAAPASASPAALYGEPGGHDRQPPPYEGWGIFNRNSGEFSAGIDTFDRRSLWQLEASLYRATPKDLPSSFAQDDAFASS